MIILFVPLYYIKIPIFSKSDPEHRLENIIDVFYQIKGNSFILAGIIG